jgi:excisionase family DNA binding protein
MSEKLTFTVEEAGRMLGVSRNTAYACARSGELPVVKLGHRLVVPKAALLRLLEGAGQKPSGAEAA